MNDLGPWHTEDFETLSWHDVHVHGLRLDSYVGDEGTADLVLDIDYILEWRESEGHIVFSVCQAALRFHKISGLRVRLDYATPRAGMAPFSIDGIEREPLVFSTGYESYRWHIPINWPGGLIELESPGFTQTLLGTPAVQAEQWLDPEKRNSDAGPG